MTTDEVREVFRLLLASYPTQRQRISSSDIDAMALAYRAGLGDLDAGAARAAVLRLVRTSKWIPTIAEIREAVGVVTNGSPRTGLEAWREITAKIGRYGGNRTPGVDFTFSDPITAAIVTAPLWRELCASDNSTADRARFVEAYQLAQARERRDVQASRGAVAKALPAASGEAVAQLEQLSGDLAITFRGRS